MLFVKYDEISQIDKENDLVASYSNSVHRERIGYR